MHFFRIYLYKKDKNLNYIPNFTIVNQTGLTCSSMMDLNLEMPEKVQLLSKLA